MSDAGSSHVAHTVQVRILTACGRARTACGEARGHVNAIRELIRDLERRHTPEPLLKGLRDGLAGIQYAHIALLSEINGIGCEFSGIPEHARAAQRAQDLELHPANHDAGAGTPYFDRQRAAAGEHPDDP